MTDFSVDPGEKGQFYGPNGFNIAIPVLNGSIVVHPPLSKSLQNHNSSVNIIAKMLSPKA